ncbi:putative folate/biopterin transporter [Leishmania major strain Friedlin]|uniref:Putative folate/biopterin transporter n=1 Tax=Leishmania major TaxID=5664 RepID=Q4QHI2_LEIMA|nr:putative folate/biopterin transporter [Leishmania major strain Friedlin]CAG9570011.1 pteridine_transporter_(truncated)_-_putative [Leishmania major strain Friedlin]CAJ02513.1 putative folate/biopterin transporter [Leishmania major strain Friedlin]|eukprot:XP_001681366.1 putative folate/biopterin transporter [Leishmania major strain Friedlin]
MRPRRFVHPEAATLFSKWPWVRRVPIFGEAVEGYGPKVIVALGATNLLCRGLADRILTGQTYAMMMDRYGISVPRYQRLSTIATMGWSIKAFTAMLCDGFAFLGYTKRWCMFISCVGGGAFALLYGLLPAKEASADVAATFIFLSTWGKANVDILSEGHYSRLMRENPKPGPSMVSWIWFWIMVGAIIATVMNGPLADAGKPQISIFVSAALQAITCVFYLFNWYGEKKNRVLRSEDALFILEETRKERERLGLEGVNDGTAGAQHGGAAKGKKSPQHSHSDEDVEGAVRDALNDGQRDNGELVQDVYDDAYDDGEGVAEGDVYYGKPPVPCLFGLFEANTEVISKNWKIFVYSVVMTCAVITMLCANMLADTLGLLVACVVVSTICCATSFWALPLVIAKANVFGYLQQAVYINIASPLMTFYLNSYNCEENFPNFSYSFYNTVAGVIGKFAALAGVSAFNCIFSKCSYRLTFCVTTFAQVLGGMTDIVIVKRWNLYIGIPDHAMYIWGAAVVSEVCYMLGYMPMVVLLSRLCPRGSESVVYALMAGFASLGRSTSASLGAIIMEYGLPVFKTQDDGYRCGMENLAWLLFVCNVCAPPLVLPLTLLLPKARICDDVDIDGKALRRKVDAELMAVETGELQSPPSSAENARATKAQDDEATREKV